jgi:hypothetical protein
VKDLKTSTLLKWITGGLELLLGIPILGALVIISSSWTALWVMLAFHIVTLVFSARENTKIHGSILGIIASIAGIIPIVGMIMHLITGGMLLADASQAEKTDTL